MSIPPILLAIALMALTRASVQNVIMAITIAEIPARLAPGARCRAVAARAALRRGGDRRRHHRPRASSCATSCPTPWRHYRAGDLHLRLGDDHRVDPLLHRRRHAADHSVVGQHHGRWPRALAGQALHHHVSRRSSCRSPCSPSICLAMACATRSTRAWPRGSRPHGSARDREPADALPHSRRRQSRGRRPLLQGRGRPDAGHRRRVRDAASPSPPCRCCA